MDGERTKKDIQFAIQGERSRLQKPSRLFNFGPGGNVSRATDIHKGDKTKEAAPKDLARAALAPKRRPMAPKSQTGFETLLFSTDLFSKSGKKLAVKNNHPKTTSPPQNHHNLPSKNHDFLTQNRETPLKNAPFTTNRKSRYRIAAIAARKRVSKSRPASGFFSMAVSIAFCATGRA
jgi:hypothetical protein